jgi:hypothetical protein
MRPLTASEAISPALDRTKDLLARPFRWQTFFKIAAIAFFAEIGGGFNLNLPSRGGSVHDLPSGLLAFIVAFAVIIGLVSLVIGLILFYVGSRLQLVLVELVATRQTTVAPVWRRVGQPTWRWIGLKLLYFLAMLVPFALVALPAVFYFVSHHSLPSFDYFSQLHIAEIVLLVMGCLLVLLIAIAGYMLLRDFALPHIALEDVSVSEALRRLCTMVADEPGAIALFLLLRLLLMFVFAIVAEIGIGIVVVISLIPFGIVGGGLWVALHHTGPGMIALIGCGVVGGLIFLCWLVFLGISGLGAVYTFSQAYSLYFLGGRYPLVGTLLERSTPPPTFSWDGGYPGPYQPLPGAPPPPAAG